MGVPPERIAVTEGVCKFLRHPGYLQVAEWVRSAGLSGADEVEGTACMLYHRGWRAEHLHLLEASDTHRLAHLSPPSRMLLMEKAAWQRDHHRQMRRLYSGRVKERDWRYMAAKYTGILSASVAFCGAFSLFGWNYRSHLTHQRSYQMRFAVRTLCRRAPPGATSTADAAHHLSRQTRRGALALACEHRMCHVVELPLEALTVTSTLLPRLDFYTVPNFSRSQAHEYIPHRLDALDTEAFLDTVGTSRADLDELLAAAHQSRASPAEYTSERLLRAMRQLQAAWGDDAQLKTAVKRLAQLPYGEGQHEGVDGSSLRLPSLRDVVLYNPVQDAWHFRNR
ncbi:hypothetical protein Q4I28_000274, partial [Leishmania naiffi]